MFIYIYIYSNIDNSLRDGVRACTRGIGPARQCGALDMKKVAALPDSQAALVAAGPPWPRDGALVGCWWAMREIELSTARCKQVKFFAGLGCGTCEVDLPVSKSDPQALGKLRRHGCFRLNKLVRSIN